MVSEPKNGPKVDSPWRQTSERPRFSLCLFSLLCVGGPLGPLYHPFGSCQSTCGVRNAGGPGDFAEGNPSGRRAFFPFGAVLVRRGWPKTGD